MRILIVGAGATGRTLAVTLREMNHDVVLLDHNPEALATAEALVDVMTFVGQGASPRALDEAGIAKTDLALAVTNCDEVNILACLYAQAAGVRTKVARVSNTDYLAPSRWDWKAQGLDLIVSQSEECATEARDILRYPGAIDVVDLFERKILAIGVRVGAASPLVDRSLAELGARHEILSRSRILALLRNERMLIPRGETRIQEGDDAYVVLRAADVDTFLDWTRPARPRIRRHILAGGGGVGLTLALKMEQEGHEVVLIERDGARADLAAEKLSRSLVLKGDAAKQDTLREAGIGSGTAFAGMTGDDELNIVSCVLAKKMGADWTVAQSGKPEYVPIIRHMQLLDRVLSPYATMINVILRFVRGRNVRAATLFQSLPGELLEVEISESSKWRARPLRDVALPGGAIVALVQRGRDVFIPAGDFPLQAADRLAVFAEMDNASRVASLLKK
jgi:trk system potassium uptake protein